jgi:hypothetical protein
MGQHTYTTGEVGFHDVLQYELIEHEGIDLIINDRLAVLPRQKGHRGNAAFGQPWQGFRWLIDPTRTWGRSWRPRTFPVNFSAVRAAEIDAVTILFNFLAGGSKVSPVLTIPTN